MATLLPGLGNGSSKHAGFKDKHLFLILQMKTKKGFEFLFGETTDVLSLRVQPEFKGTLRASYHVRN